MLTWRSNWEVERSSAGGKCVSLLSLSVRWKKGGKERPRKTSHQCELRFWKKKKKRPTRSLRSISSSIYIYIYFEFGWKCRIVFFFTCRGGWWPGSTKWSRTFHSLHVNYLRNGPLMTAVCNLWFRFFSFFPENLYTSYKRKFGSWESRREAKKPEAVLAVSYMLNNNFLYW